MRGGSVISGLGMASLGDMHDAIAHVLPKDGRVLYLDYAFTTNVGDLLIVLGTLKFFQRYDIKVKLAHNIHSIGSEGLQVAPGDVLVFHGGGNFGDIYPHFQALRERLVKACPSNKVVIMPQTVHFDDPAEQDRSCRVLAEHPDITLFVRDRRSLEIVRPYFGGRAKLAPDMAHQLWPSLISEVRQIRSAHVGPVDKPLFLVRRDAEKAAIPPALSKFESSFTDWDVLVGRRYRIERAIIRRQYAAARMGIQLYDLDRAYFNAARREVMRVAACLYRYPIWVTSRMHGAILGLLLGKPVFALDNIYGKLSSYFEAWGTQLSPVQLVSSQEEAAEMMRFLEQYAHRDQHDVIVAYRKLNTLW